MQSVASITVNGPTNFTIKTKTPVAAVVYSLLAGVEFAPMAPSQFTPGADLGRTAIGAGPMMIKSFEPGVKVTLVKNPNYIDADDVPLAGMEYIHAEAGAPSVNALQAGQVDYTALLPSQLDGLPPQYTVDAKPTTAPYTQQLCVKAGTPLGDARVRQAMAYALDREAFNQVLFGGRSQVAWDLWPSSSPWHDESLDGYYDQDIPKAKQLLTDAGYPNGFSFDTFSGPAGTDPRLSEMLQQQYKAVGINMGIVQSANTGTDFYQLVKAPATISQSRPGPLDKLSRFYLSNSFANVCKFPVPEVDALYAKLAALPLESPEAIDAWHDIQQQIFAKLAFFPQTVFQLSSFAYDNNRVGAIKPYYDQLGTRQPDPEGSYIKK
jgi:ABC-type transport system substrate-binding protein